MKKGIIFDVDGTLWDSCAAVAESLNEYLKKYAADITRRVTEADLRGVMGMPMTQLRDTLFDWLPPRRRMEIAQGCFEYEIEYLKKRGGELYPNLRQTMEKLAETYHLYIVSNCQRGYIEDFIAWAKVEELIEDFECFGATGLEKSRNIRLVAERNSLDAAVYVGDTEGDRRSAREAGIPFIHARYGFGTVEGDVPCISDLSELPEVADEILK